MKEQLEQYGLTSKEADIYLACLKSGEITAHRISALTGIKRSTVYEIIEKLKKQGIINSVIKEKKFYFNAIEPSGLIGLLKEKEQIITDLLPSLNKISKSITEKSKVWLFEGLSSIKPAVLDMLNYKKILVYGAGSLGDEFFGSFIENFARKRLEKKVFVEAIMGTNVPSHMLDSEISEVTKIKKLKIFNDYKTVYFVYEDKFLSISLGEDLIAVKIHNKIFADSQRELFGLLWKIAKE
ncbi:hypothetical protein JW756_02330 [Candidatus Woesearchaeota archaeon]|nr:hypothetical protein [Candidatus Woesearchaeota archaeon]